MIDELEEKRVTQYLIPANVSTKFEFFPGFGWYEFKIVFIAGVIGTIIFFALSLPKKTIHVNKNTIDQTQAIDPMNASQDQNILQDKQVQIVPRAIRIFVILVPCIAAFFLVKRNPNNNMSLLVLIKNAREFKRNQKLYLYKYKSGSEVTK